MNKKIIIATAVVVFCMLVGINIYIYIGNEAVKKHLDNTEYNTQTVVTIGSLRTNLNKLSENQKLYMLTGKEQYKDKYDQEINLIYNNIKQMREDGAISENEEKELVLSIQNYDKLNDIQIDFMNGYKISEELENKIIESYNEQIVILTKLEESIESTQESLSKANSSINDSSQFQRRGVQFISALMTLITSVSAYIITNNPNKSNKTIGKIVDLANSFLNEEEDNIESRDSSIPDNQSYNTNYQKCLDNITNYEKMVKDIRLISKQIASEEYKLQDIDKNISKIEISILKLKSKIESKDKTFYEINEDILKSIELEIISLKISLQALPIYNDVIVDILNSMQNEYKINI